MLPKNNLLHLGILLLLKAPRQTVSLFGLLALFVTHYPPSLSAAPLAQPTITSPSPGAILNHNQPTFSGANVLAGSTVTVTVNGSAICTITADAHGRWQCRPTTLLDEGSHTLLAIAEDQAGVGQSASSPQPLTVDMTAPITPTVTSPAPGATTDDPTPTFIGLDAEVGSQVMVKLTNQSQPLCLTRADEHGDWFCIANQALPLGAYDLLVTATDRATNISPALRQRLTIGERDVTDADGDTLFDRNECPSGAACPDTDGDGQHDYLDLDSDNDGLLDQSEGEGDADQDGLFDYLENNLTDRDGDDWPNHLDADDDGDELFTRAEDLNHNGNWLDDDGDSDLVPAYLDATEQGGQPTDSDGDGLFDSAECIHGAGCLDSDTDSVPDYLDTDDDNDDLPTRNENPDPNQDGNPNDAADSDADGAPDYLDTLHTAPIIQLNYYLPLILD
jgi:hypothetical protein